VAEPAVAESAADTKGAWRQRPRAGQRIGDAVLEQQCGNRDGPRSVGAARSACDQIYFTCTSKVSEIYFTMSTNRFDPERWLDELPEPDAFAPEEFNAWRGLLRLRETTMREIDRRLREQGELSLADYGVLITLVDAPRLRLRMSDLGTQRMLTPSGITRVVARLEERRLIRREADPADGRASFAALTRPGLEALRRAQVIHHATVRETFLGRLTQRDIERLAQLFEKSLPGAVSARAWPPPPKPEQRPTKPGATA
jgi:DNA-binding MarR family transcriptional regulator